MKISSYHFNNLIHFLYRSTYLQSVSYFLLSKLFRDYFDLGIFNLKNIIFKNSPILVWQMGKVGSRTVTESLKMANLGVPIIHTHFLSKTYIENIEKSLRSIQKENTVDFDYLKKLSNFVYTRRKKYRWKIITLTRDPVAREISDFFENSKRDFPNLELDLNEDNLKQCITILIEKYKKFDEKKDYATQWFNREINDIFQFDIYKYKFDQKKGYHIYEIKNADILVIRLENLTTCFDIAMKSLLRSSKEYKLKLYNVGEEKIYNQLYNSVKTKIKIPLSVLDRIYSSCYAKTFYSENEISQFKKRWMA